MSTELIDTMRRERDEAKSRLQFCHDWYAVRIKRIEELAKEKGIWHEVACILANGTADIHEPPTYAQQLNRERYRADKAEAECNRLRDCLTDFAEGDCAYGDNCPTFGSRHGRCYSCRARSALKGE